MMNYTPFMGLLAVIMTFSACSSMDRADSQIDMAAGRLSEPGPIAHEGPLLSSKRIGAMTSLQFQDGSVYDVNEASPLFQSGDIVRIYKTEKGLEARLWKAAPSDKLPPKTSTKQ